MKDATGLKSFRVQGEQAAACGMARAGILFSALYRGLSGDGRSG
jgi:hypothetical protein